MSGDKWYFDRDLLANTPSRRHGIPAEKEQTYLQTTANFIQEMGRRLSLPLLCINTAVLYTQRFYLFHPLSVFERYTLGSAALFLAAKVEEHPRKVAHICQMARVLGLYDKAVKDAVYIEDLLFNENVLITTLGFELQVQHPHQHILRLCNLIKVEKSLSQTAYILATYCLHLTQMCLIYKPIKIACLCVHMACKMTGWEIPLSKEGKPWYQYDDATITGEILENLCDEFLGVLGKCPEKCKNKTLLANPENLVKKLVGNVPPAGPSQVASPEATFSQNLVTLHDGMRKVASSLSKQSSLESVDTVEWSVDESNHDPNKHDRKMNPTPTKQDIALSTMAIAASYTASMQPTSALPRPAVKTDRGTPYTDPMRKSVNDPSQRNVCIPPSPTLLKKTSNTYATTESVPKAQHMAQMLHKPMSNTPSSITKTAVVMPSIQQLPYKHSQTSQPSLLRIIRPTLSSKSATLNEHGTTWRRTSLSTAQAKPSEGAKKLSSSSNESLHNFGTAQISIQQQGKGLVPAAWGSMPSLALPRSNQPHGSLKISIPKSRISGFQASSSLHRPATPDDFKTDKSKVHRLPTTASMGSSSVFSEPKRFKPNPGGNM